MPIADIAQAIESSDLDLLKGLKGIGARGAQKIIAALQGKVSKFVLIRKTDKPEASEPVDFLQPVYDVLITQLGHKPTYAKRMVTDALRRNPDIDSPEALFDEVYRGEKP